MSFLSKLGKDIGVAAEKAKFEADKALKLNRLGSELGDLNSKAQQLTASIGAKVMEMHVSGQLQVPELEGLFGQVETLNTQIAAKKAELEAMRGQQFAPAAPAASASGVVSETAGVKTAETAPTAQPGAAPSKFCPNCGTAAGGASFCPSCGQKLG
jgi:outer membrane murein-binding lipoprotein Lpp